MSSSTLNKNNKGGKLKWEDVTYPALGCTRVRLTTIKVNRMKAAVLVSPNEPLELVDLDIPELGVGQVLVKVHYSGICGKQIDEITGRRSDPFLPHLLGHEGSGIVADVGVGVKKVKAGDHVVLHWMKGSGIDSDPPRYQWGDKTVSAGWVTTFSDYTIASENRVTKIPDDIDMDVAALMGCAVTTGLGIVFNNANLKPGQSILVMGAGGVGINVVQGASLVNAYPIDMYDKFIRKVKRSMKFGSTSLILEQDSYDVVVDTTGNKGVREWGYNKLNKNGKLILAGVPHEGETMEIDSYGLHGGKQIIGCHGGDTKPDTDIPRYLNLYKLGKLKLKEQITHTFPLEKINEAIEIVRKGEAIRCLISIL